MGEPVKCLRQTKAELRAAERALEAMKEAGNIPEYVEAWQALLDRLEKVWRKAERECERVRPRFQPWQGRFKKLRRDDELLRYLHHARNADQHTIQLVTAYSQVGLEISIPPGGTAEIRIDREAGKIRVGGQAQDAKELGPRFVLLPVADRGGKVYNPPTRHRGRDIRDADPLLVAEEGIGFYRWFIAQIETRFFLSETER